VLKRFAERARARDPALEADLFDLYQKDDKDSSVAQLLLDETKFNPTAVKETAAIREYMLKEGVQQYRDYFESDSEEQKAFEYIDNLDNRGRIRFMEIFEDYTI
jgi:hypothetical protein